MKAVWGEIWRSSIWFHLPSFSFHRPVLSVLLPANSSPVTLSTNSTMREQKNTHTPDCVWRGRRRGLFFSAPSDTQDTFLKSVYSRNVEQAHMLFFIAYIYSILNHQACSSMGPMLKKIIAHSLLLSGLTRCKISIAGYVWYFMQAHAACTKTDLFPAWGDTFEQMGPKPDRFDI